jgi:transposase InsO family protein
VELLKASAPSVLEVLVSHGNAPLTVEGKRRLCERVDRGRARAHVAAGAGISRQCLSKWHGRWQAEGLAGLLERSSRPHHSPNRTPASELIHIDVKKLGHIRDGGGWWAHGRDSAQQRAARNAPRVGYDYVHVAVDDHSRLAYVEVIAATEGGENGPACAGFLRRAAAFYAGHGVTVERVMTDNAMAYTRSRLFAAALAEIGARHVRTKPRCPWTNGKAERFNRTLAAEWAYAAVYDSSAARVAALPAWLHGYNHHRPHTALGGHPPAHRVNNLCPGDS